MFVIATLALAARPIVHVLRARIVDREARPAVPAGFVDDASGLNRTSVREVWSLPTDTAEPERQLRELLERARAEGLRVSIAGARHSMGGHTFYPGGIVVDMLPWNRMELDASGDVLTVGAGALWSDVLPFLDRHGRSVRVMQSNSSFSVGGSVSVNCHGWQFGAPPIASTVLALEVMLADGSVVRCSRTERPELFSLILGGYGLFGVILEVDLAVVPNERYRREQVVVPVDELVPAFVRAQDDPDVRMLFARLNVVPDELFAEAIVSTFRVEDGAPPALAPRGWLGLRRAIFRGSENDEYGKRLRWWAETRLQGWIEDEVVSRNHLLGEGTEVFENRSAETTDVLHEYFVPIERVDAFVPALRAIVAQSDVDLLNVTVRHVEEDQDTFLRWADREMLAFVMLFVQPRTAAGEDSMRAATRRMIDAALAHGGRYYLPYRPHATQAQLEAGYPRAQEFFARKRVYDPGELFQSRFYERYGASE